MPNLSIKLDPTDLTNYENSVLLPALSALGLNLVTTPSFVAENFLGQKLEKWFNDNTSDGWVEMRDAWMNVEYGQFNVPESASFEFHSVNEALLFKLTFEGVSDGAA